MVRKALLLLGMLLASATADAQSVYSGTLDFSGATVRLPNGTSNPATCTVSDIFVNTTTGAIPRLCTAVNTWTNLLQGSLGATDNVIPRTSGTGGATLDGGSSNPPTYDDTGTIAATAAPGITFPTRGFAPATADIAVAGATNSGWWFGVNGSDEYVAFLLNGTTKLIVGGPSGGVNVASDRNIGINGSTNTSGNNGAYWGRHADGVFSSGGGLAAVGGTNHPASALIGTYIELHTEGSGAPYSVPAGESGATYTNEGATAEGYLNLPTAATTNSTSLVYCAAVQDADGMRFVAAAGDTIRVRDKVTAAAGYISSTTIGSIVCLKTLNATEWFAFEIGGVWTDGTFTYDDTSLTTP